LQESFPERCREQKNTRVLHALHLSFHENGLARRRHFVRDHEVVAARPRKIVLELSLRAADRIPRRVRDRGGVRVPEEIFVVGEKKRLEVALESTTAAQLSDELAFLIRFGQDEGIIERVVRLKVGRFFVGDFYRQNFRPGGSGRRGNGRGGRKEPDGYRLTGDRFVLSRLGSVLRSGEYRGFHRPRLRDVRCSAYQRPHHCVSDNESDGHADARLLVSRIRGWWTVLVAAPAALRAFLGGVGYRLATKVAEFLHALPWRT